MKSGKARSFLFYVLTFTVLAAMLPSIQVVQAEPAQLELTQQDYITIFESDFEGPDNEWDGVVAQGNGASVNLNATHMPYAGAEHGEYNFSVGTNVGAYCYKSFGDYFSNLTFSAWYSMNNTANWRELVEIWGDNGYHFTLLFGFGTWRAWFFNTTGQSADVYYAINKNTYQNITIENFINVTNGYHRVYINGTRIFNIVNLNNAFHGDISGMRVGATLMSDTYNNTCIRVDNVFVKAGSPFHDVAINDLTATPATVFASELVSVNVTVQNQGDYPETFNVSIYANTTLIETRTVTNLAANATSELTFNWNTIGVKEGNYTLRAVAETVPHELDTADNTFTNGIVTILLGIHDVAIRNVTPLKTFVEKGQTVNITIVAANEGNFSETFNVTTYANSTVIGTFVNITLSSGNSTTLTLTWNTSGFASGNYSMNAVADTVPNETDTADNSYVNGAIKIKESPTANFAYSPTAPFTSETVTFNASFSTSDGGTIISYEWNFGDGTNETGMITTHAYAENGTYTVTLIVTDSDGLNSTSSQNITILNRSPVAIFTESATSVPTGTAIHFNASASYDPDGSLISYFWDFGDGTNGTGVMIDHTYADNGTYTVTLNVTDNDGATATFNEAKTVTNRPPTASFTESATTVYIGDLIYFNASASYDPDGIIVDFFWEFGDGTNASGIIVSHAYTNNGTYMVMLEVIDDDGISASTNATKTVLNRPDIAVINVVSQKTVAGLAYNLTINVTVANQGYSTENFNVTVYANTTIIARFNITLLGGSSTTVIFTWNTAGFAYGNYTLSAYAWPVENETDVGDNNLMGNWVFVSIPGDINGDTYVNAKDAVLLGAAFHPRTYNPNADINNDGRVNAKDAVILGAHFNEHWE